MTILLTFVLVMAALGIGFLGLLFSSQASLGPAIVGFGCLLAILARMAQASGHEERRQKDAAAVAQSGQRPSMPA